MMVCEEKFFGFECVCAYFFCSLVGRFGMSSSHTHPRFSFLGKLEKYTD